MKRLHILTIGMVLLAWAMLAAFGNVSASPSIETPRLGNPSTAILVTPTPTIPKGTPPPKTTALPPSTKPASGHDTDKVRRANLGLQSTQAPRQPASGWQLIYSDGFEIGNWPYSPWMVTDLSNDGYDRKWGRSDYFGFWGLWPAAGGTHRVDPPTQYANNLHTRMQYGPFDLHDAKLIDLYFWLWRDIEDCCDYLVFEASVNGSSFQELGRWTDYGDWAQQVFYLDQYAGQSQVWVAWRFYSNSSITYAGPWVDDVEIWKYVPGQVTAQGIFSYADRNGVHQRARFTKVYLYDQDPGGTDDQLAVTTTDANGFFQFPARMNWDADDPDPDPNNRRLDLYVVWETDVNDSAAVRRRVTNFTDQAYRWPSFTSTNASDGTVDFSTTLPVGWSNLAAMWIFQDLRRAWEYVSPTSDPGSITAKWQNGSNCYPFNPGICSSFFYAAVGGPFVFISDQHRNSMDTVVHEAGHHYMYNATQWWLWWDVNCYQHNPFDQKDVFCAWSEGWGDFFALTVNSTLNVNDTCYDWGIGSCGAGGGAFENLETPTWGDNRPQSDTVEGRVAGALYDLWDSNNEPIYDSAIFGFAPIWNIVRAAPHETTFREFWNSWETSGNNRHHAMRAIYQNTIDYDDPPAIDLPNQPVSVLQNITWIHALDLWEYSSDDESADAELGWQILNVTDPRCGVSLDANRYVNLAPQQGWLGSCDVTISVSDSIKFSTDTFRVNVVPVASRNFLPIILK